MEALPITVESQFLSAHSYRGRACGICERYPAKFPEDVGPHGCREGVATNPQGGSKPAFIPRMIDVIEGDSGQADTERSELELERTELNADDRGEHKELEALYVARGLEPALATQVAEQLMAHDALGAHARDELGISEALRDVRFRLPWHQREALALERRCLCWSLP